MTRAMTGCLWLDAAAGGLAALWLTRALLIRRGVKALTPLDALGNEASPPPGGWPRVSIVVASLNEADHVLEGVGSLLHLDYPDYEVIAVNDRSTDATGERLEELARRDQRVRVVHVTELPEGWIGKTHALWRGAAVAGAPWVLFTDADVRFHPGILRRTVRRCVDRELDFLTLFPHAGPRSIWMKGFNALAIGAAVLLLGVWAPRKWRRWFPMGGAGAFLLVRRDAYERAGGHEKIRLRVVDDLALGFLLHRAGGRTEIAMAHEWLSVPYAPLFRDLVRVTRKNAFAILEYSWPAVAALSLALLVVDVAAPLVFLLDWRLWPFAAAVWLGVWASYAPTCQIVKAPPTCFLLHPLLSLLILIPIWSSAIAITREGGVRWRDSFYPLAMLRRGG